MGAQVGVEVLLMLLRSPSFRICAALVPTLLPCLGGAAAITGVCPDGSIFIVQRASAIPCPQAREVDPNDVPPLNPEFLPRPYGWERFNRRSDPNNPYNLVGAEPPSVGAAPVTAPQTGASGSSAEPTGPDPRALGRATPMAVAPQAPSGVELALADQELRDLETIVDLMQEHAPATLVRMDAEGQRSAVLRLARSEAFEAHVHGVLARRGTPSEGAVVLFRALADREDAFHGNLTFVQGHVAYHPDASDPAQFGVIDGSLGALAPQQSVLGYAVLPAHVDVAAPMDVYWDDRRMRTTLRP
jgi:hypothetical protein